MPRGYGARSHCGGVPLACVGYVGVEMASWHNSVIRLRAAHAQHMECGATMNGPGRLFQHFYGYFLVVIGFLYFKNSLRVCMFVCVAL